MGGEKDDEGQLTEGAELSRMQSHISQLSHSLHDLHDELRSARVVEMRAIDALGGTDPQLWMAEPNAQYDSWLTIGIVDGQNAGSLWLPTMMRSGLP